MTQLCTVDDLAASLRVSRDSIYRMVRRGQLRAHRLSNGPKARLRFRPEDVERALQTTDNAPSPVAA